MMRFVHLAPRHVVGRIRKNGIRKGDGLRGKGVYAVPLYPITVISPKNSEWSGFKEYDTSVLVSSSRLWRHLFKWNRGRPSQSIAVVFSAPDICWPLDLYMVLPAKAARTLLPILRTNSMQGISMSLENQRWIEDTTEGANDEFCHYGVATKLSVSTSKGLGKILYYFRHSNKTLWSDGEDDFEVVFRNPIPPKAIERLIPLYRTNKQFRAFRDSRKRNGE